MRNDSDCLASCIAYLTGESIENMPDAKYATFHAGMWLSVTWTRWCAENGYYYRMRRRHYKGNHVAVYGVEGQGVVGHAVVCKGNMMLYDPFPDLPLLDIVHSIKIWS